MIFHYFLSANSAQGHVDLTSHRALQLAQVTRTIGYPRAFFRSLTGSAMVLAREQGLRLDIVHHALDGEVCGLIVPERGAAVFNTPLLLDRSRHVTCLHRNAARDEVLRRLEKVYGDFAAAKQVHDAWEKLYIAQTDFVRLDALAQTACDALTGGKTSDAPGQRTDAFFGAATPDGPVDYIACLTENLTRRIFLKGRPGTGKSTFLRKLADTAQQAGHDIEVYRCSFDTDSLDLLIVRDISFCIFDSTAPHAYFPTRTGDEILDLYAAAVRPGTDERYASQLLVMAQEYRRHTADAARHLAAIRDATETDEAETTSPLDTSRAAVAMEQLLCTLF